MASPSVGPVGGYHPSPSLKFPETFGALIKTPLDDSITLMKEYGLEAAISDKMVPDEARLDNLNKLMLHFGVSFLPLASTSSVFSLFLTRRSVTGCIQDHREKDLSSLLCGTADEYPNPLPVWLYFWLRCVIVWIHVPPVRSIGLFQIVTQDLIPSLWQ